MNVDQLVIHIAIVTVMSSLNLVHIMKKNVKNAMKIKRARLG